MAFKFGRFKPKKGDLHEFGFSLGYLVAATLSLAFLMVTASKNFKLKPVQYELGAGGVSFTVTNSDETKLSHMYVSAAGSVDNSKDNSDNPWSPWIDSGLKVAPGQCLRIKATGSVHLSLRRIVSEKLQPYLLFLHESPNYVGPDGTQNKDTTSHQRFLKDYSLFQEAPLGKLIARIKPYDRTNVNVPFQVGTYVAYTVPTDAASGTLSFAINDISFRKVDADGYRRNRSDHSNATKRKMEEAWLGLNAPMFTLSDAEDFMRDHQRITDLAKSQQERKEISDKDDQEFKQWYARHFWFNEAQYDIISQRGYDEWQKTTPQQLLDHAMGLRDARKRLIDSVIKENYDVWYKDNLGGFWVTVELPPAGETCN